MSDPDITIRRRAVPRYRPDDLLGSYLMRGLFPGIDPPRIAVAVHRPPAAGPVIAHHTAEPRLP